MSGLRVGSLFSGGGGLDLAVEAVFGGRTVWHCENDAAAAKVLACRWPGVPNFGDIMRVNWSKVEPVDVLCAGWPCQPFSLAGRRKGVADERALWPYVAGAVRVVRPRIVVLENVSAVLGPEFSRVADDLAALGYDLRWTCLRASDIGTPHRRERIFVIAHAKCPGQQRWQTTEPRSVGCGRASSQSDGYSPLTPDTASVRWHEGWPESARLIGGSNAAVSGAGPLLPTHAVNDIGEGKTVEWWDEFTAKSKAKHGNGNGHGNSLAIEAQRMSGAGPVNLLPTPTVADSNSGHLNRSGARFDELLLPGVARAYGNGELLPTSIGRDGKGTNQRGDGTCLTGALLPTPTASDGDPKGGPNAPENRLAQGHHVQLIDLGIRPNLWGKYEAAIRRWEMLTRSAPAPTEPNTKGNLRLAAAFSEWLMGWPDGWVTQVPGVSRNDALRIIGNGVVPQQAVAALQFLLSIADVT